MMVATAPLDAITLTGFIWLPKDMVFAIPGPHHGLSLILMALVGACMGSFLNVVAHRFLTGQSLSFPASHCPACQHTLAWYENIPVVSYLSLMGRCRQCKSAIGWDSVLTELATAALYAGALWAFHWSWLLVLMLFLLSQLVVIFLTDWKESLIFELNSLSLIPAGLLLNLMGWGNDYWPNWTYKMAEEIVWTIPTTWGDGVVTYGVVSAILGIAVAFVFFEGIIALSQRFLGTDGFGHGDTHLMMGVGAYLGWERMLAALFLGFVVQTALAIPWLVWRWFQQGRWIALLSAIGSVVFALLPMGKQLPGLASVSILTLTLVSVVGALVCLLVFLRQLRQQTEYLYVPLGPALILGTLGVMAAPFVGH